MNLSNGCAIVNYCTNDYRYLALCLEELRKVFKWVIVPVCDHFFDGVAEDRALLEQSYAEHPDVHFIEFAFGKTLYGLNQFRDEESKKIHFWHSTARYVAWHYLPKEAEWALFLDVDEILDTDRFIAWANQVKEYDAIRFDSYFYYQVPTMRSTTFMQNGLMVKRDAIKVDDLLVTGERMTTFERAKGEKLRNARGLDDCPLIHHYSWVRSDEEFERKVRSWGHHAEQDWEALLKKEFTTIDPLFEKEYEECVAVHNPFAIKKGERHGSPKVTKINRERLLERHFRLFY